MTQQKGKLYKLTIVATAFNEPYYNRAFTTSIVNQTCKEFNAVVWNNGPASIPDGVVDNGILYRSSDTNTGNYGCTNRQQAINECDTEYILQTSVQDYWLPQAMEYIIKTINRTDADIIIWNSINHLVGPCKVLESDLQWSKIDWGNFCIKTDIAKKVGINHPEQYCADWFFVKDVLESGLLDQSKILKLPYVLTIHN